MTSSVALARAPIGSIEYPRESAFRAHIRYRARALGWKLYEVPDSRFVQGNGYPDITMVHPGLHRLAFVECKTDIGRYTDEQGQWFDALLTVAQPGVYVFLWRPRDAAVIESFLSGEGNWEWVPSPSSEHSTEAKAKAS